VTHEEEAGRPSTSTNDEKIQQARGMVLANRRVAIDEVACSLQISHGSAYQIIHEELGFHKICLLQESLPQSTSARPHTASQTVETINHLGFGVLEHTAYSPNLAPSDFHLFGPLKNALRGRRFSTEKEVREAVHKWLRDQPITFLEGIHNLVDRWTKCIEKEGDYVEKLRTCSGLHLCT